MTTYTSLNPITTQVQGYLLDPAKNPLKDYSIILEATDSKGSMKGIRSVYKTNKNGYYKFFIVEGYHNVYTLKDEDSNEILAGTVHVQENDLNKIYSLQELLNK